MTSIWVIAEDMGYEGLREPARAYLIKEDAERDRQLLSDCYKTMRVIEVPLMYVRPVPTDALRATIENEVNAA